MVILLLFSTFKPLLPLLPHSHIEKENIKTFTYLYKLPMMMLYFLSNL